MASTAAVGASLASSRGSAASSSRPAPATSPSPGPGPHRGGSTSATISSANKSRTATAVGTGLRPGRIVRKKTQQVVQWKTRNVQEGIVIVDEAQLSKLIKRDPIEKFYDMDPEPFATGMFASVRRCRSRDTGLQLAAKFSSRLRYGTDCSAEIHHEIALLSLCSPSPRVVKLHDVFQTDREIILVMEYAPGGDLQTLIDDNIVPYESDVVSFTRQLVEGLAYLHHRKIAHLDIKPQNLVMMGDFPDCDVKLCDFEISRVILEGTEIREILGTPDYVAPEILHYEPITMAADMWSLGVTVYVLLTGFSPFGGETDQETFCNISRAQLDFPEELFEDVSPEAQDFIRRLLQRDPRSRPTAKECLRHPWLSQRSTGARSCASCSPGPGPSLRKYLSKSREALFERVLQRGVSVTGSSSGRIAHQLAGRGPRRLCESQASLVSKTRDPLFNMSPSLSRSREKLYGLRSLSRSQEVLAMCRALSQLQLHCLSGTELDRLDQEEISPAKHTAESENSPVTSPASPPEKISPAVTSPVTSADVTPEGPPVAVASEPLLSTTLTAPEPSEIRPDSTLGVTPTVTLSTKTIATTSTLEPVVTASTESEDTPSVSPSTIALTSQSSFHASNTPPANSNSHCSLELSDASLSPTKTAAITGIQPNSSPAKDKEALAIPAQKEKSPVLETESSDKSSSVREMLPAAHTALKATNSTPAGNITDSAIKQRAAETLSSSHTQREAQQKAEVRSNGLDAKKSESQSDLSQQEEAEAILSALRNGLLARGALTGGLHRREPDLLAPVMVAAAHQYEAVNGNKGAAGEPTLQREQSTLSSNSESSESTLEGEEDPQGDDEYTDDVVNCEENEEDEDNESEDEPRFTVAQLITAYNLHDEVVTKSSLDFTMATTDREAKLMPPVLNTKSKFPTGPNALRLFIPDIDITNAKPRKSKSGRRASGLQSLHEEEGEGDGADARTGSFLRSESLSSTTSTMTISWEELSTQPSKQQKSATPPPSSSPTPTPPPPPPPPPPISAQPEPKKSPKPVRAAAVQRHRRSASTPSSDTGRTMALSPAGKPVSVERSSSGCNRAGGSSSTRSGKKVNSTIPVTEKLRRKSTPVFK